MKKAYPGRYAEAQRTLEGVGYAIRMAHPKQFFTDLVFEGTILNLVYRAKIPGIRTKWKIKQSYNPFENKTQGKTAPNKISSGRRIEPSSS